MSSRRRVVVGVVAVALVAGAVTAVVVRRDRDTDASREAATAYVDLVASAGQDDLPRLWAMAVSEEPAALRDAGELLLGAEDRIEVVSVGDAEPATGVDTAYLVHLDEFRQVEVTYRLDDRELRWPVRLGRLPGSSGDEVDDWRVVSSIGSIGWEPVTGGLPTDYYLGGTQLVRRPLARGSDSQVQPLYPAVYRTQTRQSSFYSSQEETVAVLPGDPVDPPLLRLTATEATKELIVDQVLSDLDSCGIRGRYTCFVDDLVEARGINTFGRGWWRGLTRPPTVSFDDNGNGATLTGGAFRYRGPDGVRLMRFEGTGVIGIDGATGAPSLYGYDLEETR